MGLQIANQPHHSSRIPARKLRDPAESSVDTLVPALEITAVSVPAVMLVSSRPNCLQNRLPPHRPQNPRSALSDDLYLSSVSDAVSSILAELALVMAAWWPLVRRHCAQWQAITPRSAPVIR